LARLGHPDSEAAVIYRDLIANDPGFLPALEGLAETGDSADINFFQSLLRHHWPSRRSVAIRALIRIGKDDVVPILLPMLKDESASVIRAMRAAIAPYRYVIDSGQFLSAALEANHFYARRNAVNLLAELGKWRSVRWLLNVVSDADTDTAKYAEQKIQEWMSPPRWNTEFTRPAERERHEIETALSASQHRLSPSTVALIESGLAQYR
jgi:HEAT repeat protein